MTTTPPRARWILAGGVLGLAISAPIARFARNVRSHIDSLGPRDAIAPFLGAPCEQVEREKHERAAGREGHA